MDRGKTGAIAIDPNEKRFVNEATTYHLFGKALLKTLDNFPGRSCFLICDHNFIKRYGENSWALITGSSDGIFYL